METNRAGANVLGSEKSVAVADAVFGTTAGWRSPLLVRWPLFAGHASMCFASAVERSPRRADARRSCEPAFVHRKNRHYAGWRPL
jgi:hypothetical protein